MIVSESIVISNMLEQNPERSSSFSTTVYTVAELSILLQDNLEASFSSIWVTGELSSVFYSSSGHCYATLKDEKNAIKIVIFKGILSQLGFVFKEGLAVNLMVTVSLYKPRGDLQLLVKKAEPAGLGALKLAFEQLKEKLRQQGLFELSHKKPLPRYPQRIGIITSPQGAVLHDMTQIINRRFPLAQLKLYPSAVQGADAPRQLIQALQLAKAEAACEVYIIARGGGSFEDLFCFNSESLVNEIFNFPFPIISAVGHETDITLCDFVADLRAPTPSAAAEMVVPSALELLSYLGQKQRLIHKNFDKILKKLEQSLDLLEQRIRHPFKMQADELAVMRNRFYAIKKVMLYVVQSNEKNITQYYNRIKNRLSMSQLTEIHEKVSAKKKLMVYKFEKKLVALTKKLQHLLILFAQLSTNVQKKPLQQKITARRHQLKFLLEKKHDLKYVQINYLQKKWSTLSLDYPLKRGFVKVYDPQTLLPLNTSAKIAQGQQAVLHINKINWIIEFIKPRTE